VHATLPEGHSIAQSQYGNSNFGFQIAIKNGYTSADETPQPCDMLDLPQYIPQSNTASNFLPYAKFMDAITGPLYPHLKFAQPKPKKRSCIKTIIEVAVSVVIAYFAPALAPFLIEAIGLGAVAGTTGMVLTGIATGLVDAALQGVASGIGLIQHFSLISAVEAGVSAGFMSYSAKTNGVFSKITDIQTFADLGRIALKAAVDDIRSQLLELAMGVRKKLDINRVIQSMTTAVVDTKINTLQLMHNSNIDLLLDDVASAFAGMVLGKAIMGEPMDIATAIGKALGTFGGQKVQSKLDDARRKMVKSPQMSALPQAYDYISLDYIKALGDTQLLSLSYDSPLYALDALENYEYESQDYTQDTQSDSTKSLGTARVSKTAGTPPFFNGELVRHAQ
jgi:hypothetical protein